MKQVTKTKIKISDVKDVFNEGYNLLSELRKDVDAPVVKAEFLTEEVTAIYGEEAARKFYDPEKFKREGAMPKPVLKTLFGEDGDRKSTRLNSSHVAISYAVFCLKKKNEHGRAYMDEVNVNWCPALGSVVANEEVIDGKSERGGHPVVRKQMKRWMLKITMYAARL